MLTLRVWHLIDNLSLTLHDSMLEVFTHFPVVLILPLLPWEEFRCVGQKESHAAEERQDFMVRVGNAHPGPGGIRRRAPGSYD